MDIGFIVSLILLGIFCVVVWVLMVCACMRELQTLSANPVARRPPRLNARMVYVDTVAPRELAECCCCMDARANTLLSCGHTELCLQCAQKMDACPLCRQQIADIMFTQDINALA